MALLMIGLALTVAAPSLEAQRLGRKLAEQGTLASLMPLLKSKETEELVKEDQTLSVAQQTELRATADRVFEAGYNRLMTATGNAYAHQLGLRDLRSLTHFYASPVAARFRAATPKVIIATMQSVGEMDFKGEVRAAFCAETKHLCSKK